MLYPTDNLHEQICQIDITARNDVLLVHQHTHATLNRAARPPRAGGSAACTCRVCARFGRFDSFEPVTQIRCRCRRVSSVRGLHVSTTFAFRTICSSLARRRRRLYSSSCARTLLLRFPVERVCGIFTATTTAHSACACVRACLSEPDVGCCV